MNRDMEHDGNEHSYLKRKRKKTEDTDFINYIERNEPSSLESLAAMSKAITLWTQIDLRQQSSTYIHKLTKRELEKIKNTTPIPKTIQKLLSSTIKSVGLQLLKCFSDSNDPFYSFADCGPVHWTNGVIDEVKSFKALINEPNLDLSKPSLFRPACEYCLEGIISNLWPDVEHTIINHYSSHYPDHLIICYWISVLKENLASFVEEAEREDTLHIFDSNQSVYRNMTSNAVYNENIYSLKYFWTKLTEEEKKANMKTWLHLAIHNCNQIFADDHVDYQYMQYYACTKVLCFLLSHLNDQNERKEFFQTHSETILKSLLITWPFQEYFLPTLVVMFDYLHHDVYAKLMKDILVAMKEDSTLELLFLKIWGISPPLFKKSFFQLIKNSSFLILTGCSVKTVCLILENFSTEEKTQILFNMFKTDCYPKLDLQEMIFENKMNLLDEIVKTILTGEDVNILKKNMTKNASQLFYNMECTEDFQAVEEFLKWGFLSEDEIQSFKNEFDVVELYSYLMRTSDEDELVHKFMNWYFKTDDELNKFKKNFITGNERYQCLEGEWDLFERYTNDCLKLLSPEEISIFKSHLLIKVCSLLKCIKFKFATKLVNWCIDSVDEINSYKRKLFLLPEGISLLHKFFAMGDEIDVDSSIEFFSPISSDTLAELKSLINGDNLFSTEERSAFFQLLDSSVAKYNH